MTEFVGEAVDDICFVLVHGFVEVDAWGVEGDSSPIGGSLDVVHEGDVGVDYGCQSGALPESSEDASGDVRGEVGHPAMLPCRC